jgi:hypothetical protein
MTAAALITAWLLVAIQAWGSAPIPPSQQPRVDEVRSRVADSIIAVAYDADEAPLYQGSHGRARTALLLASIAALESRYAENVITGHCYEWQCDRHGGVVQATGLMQIHAGSYGIRLVGDRAALCGRAAVDCYTAFDLLDSLTVQVRVGVHIYRTNPRQFSTWASAVSQANGWCGAHAAPVTDDEVIGEGKEAER